jgi:adenine deaminase
VSAYFFHGGRLLDPRRDTLSRTTHWSADDRTTVADRPIGAGTRHASPSTPPMPGLIDAHIHIPPPEVNLHFLTVPLTLLAAKGRYRRARC